MFAEYKQFEISRSSDINFKLLSMRDTGDLVRFRLFEHIAIVHLFITQWIPHMNILIIVGNIATEVREALQ